MPEESKRRKDRDERERSTYEYHGREVEIERGDEGTRLRIDGVEIDVEVRESGVVSHAFMFKEFSTVYDLAEELIRQWGTATPRPDQPHDHDPHH